jgi:hypothetical protein
VRHHLTHVPPFQALIAEAFAAAGAEPLPEPGSESAPGSAGAGGESGAMPEPVPEAGAGGKPGETPDDSDGSGPDDSGCSVGGRGRGGASLVLLVLTGLLQRRRTGPRR